jgi:hypothetical protein
MSRGWNIPLLQLIGWIRLGDWISTVLVVPVSEKLVAFGEREERGEKGFQNSKR